MDALEAMEGTTAATHTVTLCLDAALKGQHDQAQAKLAEAAKQDLQFGSLAMEHTTKVVEDMDALRDKMAASEVMFEFSAETVPWNKRLALQAEHPPREGNMLDVAKGFNVETFSPELIKRACVAVTGTDGVRKTKIPVKTWTAMFRRLNLKQFNELYQAASATTDVSPSVPISARFLLMSQDFEASSTQPGPGTSRRSGSAAGSRRTSRRTSTAKKAPAAKAASSA